MTDQDERGKLDDDRAIAKTELEGLEPADPAKLPDDVGDSDAADRRRAER